MDYANAYTANHKIVEDLVAYYDVLAAQLRTASHDQARVRTLMQMTAVQADINASLVSLCAIMQNFLMAGLPNIIDAKISSAQK